MKHVSNNGLLRKVTAFLLALCMALPLLPALDRPAEAAFSDSAMDQLNNWGVVSGYPDGSLRPERELTRAEFVAMVNRAYGYNGGGQTPFIDVEPTSWYYDDIGSAYNAGYFTGYSPRMAHPNDKLTREQSVVMLARNMRLDPIPGEVTEFKDGRDCSDWSRGYIRAAQANGLIGGYPDGTYHPTGNITRGEMAVMLQRALGTLINSPGEHVLSDVYGNVTISSPNALLKNSTIAGDLYITGGLDLGDITLENVRVLGNIIVAGGGESQSGESIVLRNVEADSLLVDSIADQYVSLCAEGNTEIANTTLRSDAYIQDRTRPGQGLLNIDLKSPDLPATFTLSGNLETVVNETPGSTLNIAMGTVDTLTIDEKARGSSLNLDINSTATTLNLDVATNVAGVGDIDKLYVNAAGSSVDILPDTITIRPGVTATILGEEMNAAQAIESSSDPRLLAGYPKVKNIAPTSATSVYEANKAGTVYWAVSTTTDGSIPESELITPTEGNTRIALKGDLPITESNKEFSSAMEKLVPDTNYYLSTVMVDARNRHSPVKVAAFSTPDNTVPAFTTGYPTVLRNYCESVTITGTENGNTVSIIDRDSNQYPKRNYRVQVAAMPNKNCQLYYALYPTGSTAPTAQQFRTGALGKPVRSGVDDATKNRINYIELTNLEELTTYDIYLCLIDADGALSSAVQKVTFKTIDGTPPRFLYDTPAVSEEALNSLRLNVNVNEDATVYWVVSKSADYIQDSIKDGKSEWSETEWWERACRQIESGSGTYSVRSGNVRARGNTDTVVNVTGLEPATSYYVYFVAKDNANNYSEFFRESHEYTVETASGKPRPELNVKHNEQPFKYFIQANTLDNVPPTVKQEFTHYDATDNTRPYADTDIKLIFDEEVMQYSANRSNLQEALVTFRTLYQAVKDAKTDAEAATARSKLADTLRSTIKLYNAAATGNESVIDRSDPALTDAEKEKWIIDYRYVEVDLDDETGVLTLFFPGEYSVKDSSKWAVNLSSGATYYFVLDDIADISTSRNRMGRTQLENFTTVSAQVQLRNINVTSIRDQDKAATSDPVPIDMAFSMTPITTNVEDDVDWDILFWSDRTVSFEIYELDPEAGTGRGVRKVVNGEVNPTESPTNVTITNNNAVVNQDTTLDDYTGYEGRSLFRDFYKLSFFPGVTGKNEKHLISTTDAALKKSGIMTNDEQKYYGVHFTAIGSELEDTGRNNGIWDATVNFRIAVLTGASGDLRTLASNITKDKLESAEAELGISQIHSPRPFFMRAQFANSEAPTFNAKWPQFDISDTTMTISVELSRPGTLYWVVAPASTKVRQSDNTITTNYVPTIDTYAYDKSDETKDFPLEYDINAAKTANHFQRYFITLPSGAKKLVPLNGSDDKVDADVLKNGFLLTAPANDQIYSPNFTSERIKHGSMSMARGMGTIEVTDLEPDTIYLVYFVTQGTGQVYSKYVQVFQTRTEEIHRPQLILTNNTSTATITSTNMDARVDCGLFELDRLKDMTLFNASLKSILDPERSEDFETRYWVKTDNTGKITDGRHDENNLYYHEYTVLEAMRQRDLDGRGGSLFDIYAAEDYKNQIAGLIRAQGSTDLIDGQRELYVPGGSTNGKEYKSDKMSEDVNYALLAVARADAGETDASGHSLGFGAAYPLYIRDTTPPKISAIGGNMVVDYTAEGAASGKFLMGGTVVLTFDRPLYLYVQASDTRTRLTKSKVEGTPASEGTSAKESEFLAPELNNYTPALTVSTASTSDDDPVTTVQITLPQTGTATKSYAFPDDTVIYVNPYLAGQYGPARESNFLKIALHFDTEKQKIVANVSDPDLWLIDGVDTVIYNTRVIKAPVAPESIFIRPSYQELSANVNASNNTAELTATILPADADDVTITWDFVEPTDSRYVALSAGRSKSGESITITGLTVPTTADYKIMIRASIPNSSVTPATCAIVVRGGTSIKISSTTPAIDQFETAELIATVANMPTGCTIQWEFSGGNRSDFQLINSSGEKVKVQALVSSASTVTVKATIYDGSLPLPDVAPAYYVITTPKPQSP